MRTNKIAAIGPPVSRVLAAEYATWKRTIREPFPSSIGKTRYRICIDPSMSATEPQMLGRDERQQRRAAARWLLLRLRLRVCPRHWRRRPTVPEDRHVSARQVPAFVPEEGLRDGHAADPLCAEGTSRRLDPAHTAPLVIAAPTAADFVAEGPPGPAAPGLLSA